MLRENYDTMILSRIEKSFDSIMPIGSVIAWMSAVMVYFSAISNRFVLYNSIIGLVFLVISFVKRRISIEVKIVVTISIPTIMGVLSFLDGGFGSAGLSLLMISNIMAVLLLSKENSRIVGGLSLIIFIGLFIFYRYNDLKVSIHADSSLWAIQFLVFFLYIFILHTVVYSIRVYLLENIKDLEKSIIRIEELAYYDQLTGLINEYKFKEELEKVGQENREGFLVMFNINNLGIINSIYGDNIGDDVLYNIARNFDVEKKSEELLSRISGNEFSIWIPCEEDEYFYGRINKFQENFSENFNIPRFTNRIEFKASYVKHEKNHVIGETYRKARLALTHAKVRDGIEKVYYDKQLDMMFRHEYKLKETVEKYLDNSIFTIHYQPKISCYTGRIVGVEALARLNDEDVGEVSPGEFVNMIEKMNRSVSFGEMIIKKVLTDFPRILEKYGDDISVSINISPSHFISEGFSKFLIDTINQCGVPKNKITIELTEEVAINNFDRVIDIMRQLRKTDIKISLDDFGSGYSSLNYLSKLVIDEIKIDKAFVSQIGMNDKIDIMIETIVNLSKQYGLSVVAEGVETSHQYDKLNEMGCDEIQGYFFFKPEKL